MEQLTFINLEYFFLKIYECLTGSCNVRIGSYDVIGLIRPISLIVSLLLLVGIIYSILRIRQIRREEEEELGKVIVEQSSDDKKHKKWEQIIALTTSVNQSDWRLAILEADVLLEEMVNVMGYKGESLGEKLKQIENSDFTTLNQAWEAHKVRNMIAHAGSEFILSQRDMRRVIDLYKQVFEEFELI